MLSTISSLCHAFRRPAVCCPNVLGVDRVVSERTPGTSGCDGWLHNPGDSMRRFFSSGCLRQFLAIGFFLPSWLRQVGDLIVNLALENVLFVLPPVLPLAWAWLQCLSRYWALSWGGTKVAPFFFLWEYGFGELVQVAWVLPFWLWGRPRPFVPVWWTVQQLNRFLGPMVKLCHFPHPL